MELLKSVDLWFELNALWLDALALLVVCGIALKRKDVIGFVVMMEFAIIFLAYNVVRALPFWPDIDMDHQYVLGAKDALMALALFLLAAHPLITLGYILAALSCWGVWYGYEMAYSYKIDYNIWLYYFHAWSPVYFCIMLLEIYGLSCGDSNVGKRVRRAIIPLNWDRVFQPLNRLAYARITFNNRKTTE